jgi:hypothetical protein
MPLEITYKNDHRPADWQLAEAQKVADFFGDRSACFYEADGFMAKFTFVHSYRLEKTRLGKPTIEFLNSIRGLLWVDLTGLEIGIALSHTEPQAKQ